MAATIVVLPQLSSPVVDFHVSIRFVDHIIKASQNELLLSGKDWTEKDPACCPSAPVQILLRRDQKDNWKLIEKKAAVR